MGMSGVSTWGSDIGGFFAIGTRELTPELLMRWVQFGAVSPVMRMQRNGVAFPDKPRPQVEDDDQIQNWRRYAKLHTRLFPYLQAADRVYRRRGLPIVRDLALAYPNDERSLTREDEYLFGPDLLAAPVIEPGATERYLYLPPGRWIDLWRSVSYREKRGTLRVRRARVLNGRREATVPAPLEELPLFVRAGAVLPLLPADVDTLASYGPGPDAVPFKRRRGRLDLIAFPRGRWRGTFFHGERMRSVVHGRTWDLVIHGKRMRRYRVQAALPFEACSGSRIVRRSFRMRSGRITVRGC
jgi:alpha-glucosidase (family GH31 glycosyl hydrolase)